MKLLENIKKSISKSRYNISRHAKNEMSLKGNYSGMLIGRPIAILYFLPRKITAEGAEERRVVNRLFALRVPPRTLRLNSLFGA